MKIVERVLFIIAIGVLVIALVGERLKISKLEEQAQKMKNVQQIYVSSDEEDTEDSGDEKEDTGENGDEGDENGDTGDNSDSGDNSDEGDESNEGGGE